jgi:AraC-like DNA-binding protein
MTELNTNTGKLPTFPATSAEIEMVSHAKEIIKQHVYNPGERLKVNFSTYLSEKLGKHYETISAAFRKVSSVSMQQYMIELKIERAKVLIAEGKTITEVNHLLDYSSLAHLSNQFKQITGLSPSQYRKQLAIEDHQSKEDFHPANHGA